MQPVSFPLFYTNPDTNTEECLLPRELLGQIFSFSSRQEIVHLLSVSNYFLKLIQEFNLFQLSTQSFIQNSLEKKSYTVQTFDYPATGSAIGKTNVYFWDLCRDTLCINRQDGTELNFSDEYNLLSVDNILEHKNHIYIANRRSLYKFNLNDLTLALKFPTSDKALCQNLNHENTTIGVKISFRSVYFYNTETGEKITKIKVEEGLKILNFKIQDNHAFLLVESNPSEEHPVENQEMQIWSIKETKCLHRISFDRIDGKLTSCFDIQQNRLYTMQTTGLAQIFKFDMDSKNPEEIFSTPALISERKTCSQFKTNRYFLYLFNKEGNLEIRDNKTGHLIGKLQLEFKKKEFTKHKMCLSIGENHSMMVFAKNTQPKLITLLPEKQITEQENPQ